jgi:RimJ/RimL family protein N-acetyltransferase
VDSPGGPACRPSGQPPPESHDFSNSRLDHLLPLVTQSNHDPCVRARKIRDTDRVAPFHPLTDGVVTIRAPGPGDAEVLVAGRDEVFHRFLGAGSSSPQPTACIVVGDEVVGWVDYDTDRSWLLSGEVNVGYNVFADHRGRGYASRALELLLDHLAETTEYNTATLLIDPRNERSLAVAARTGFTRCGDLNGTPYFKRSIAPRA